MNPTKRLLAILAFVGMASQSVLADDTAESYWLVLSLRNGSTESLLFTDKPKITIDGQTFTVATSKRKVDYESTDVARFRLADYYDEEVLFMRADVNRDRQVDVADISSVITVMAGSASGSLADNADVNGDGQVDVADISSVITVMANSQ